MRLSFLFCMLAGSLCAFSQARINKISSVINHPAINVSAPFVSLDGNSLLFVSDNSDDDALTVFFSTKPDGVNWREPAMLPRHVHSRLNFLRGFGLTPDGKQLYVASMKGGGLGGYDLYSSDLKGSIWAEPQNLGQPANSPANEACPSFTSDGLTMYFMRCTKMDMTKAEGCKIMVSKRKNTNERWGAPEELPASINSGNSQTPRIMGDGETLIFSSNMLSPNKGGMDLYETRLTATGWSAPVPLDFANSPGDDQYVSGSSLGRYLMKDAPGKSKSEIIEVLFPPEVKPKGLMRVDGTVAGLPTPGAAYLSVFDKKTQARLFNLRPKADGTFTLYLKEGSIYTLNADPEQAQYTFTSKEFDLTQSRFNAIERVTVELKPFAKGDVLTLTNTTFKPYTHEMEAAAQNELKKLARFINGNPSLNFKVEVALVGYREDSLKSDPDLTEVATDTVLIPVTHEFIDSVAVDPITKDSSFLVRTESYDSAVVKHRYHNDRTPHMALEIVNYLIEQGVAASRLTPAHRAQVATLPEKKWLVTVTAR